MSTTAYFAPDGVTLIFVPDDPLNAQYQMAQRGELALAEVVEETDAKGNKRMVPTGRMKAGEALRIAILRLQQAIKVGQQ